ncbi:MAG: hypothetical protein FWG93_05610, partial [Oscillospiraceae bacterium]|nr:hypothetical protein [Oscillospiraceae bacterium]
MKQVEVVIAAEKLRQWAANETAALELRGRCGGGGVARRTVRRLESLRAAAARLAGRMEKTAARRGGDAAEWLLDNRYLIEREGMEAAAQL